VTQHAVDRTLDSCTGASCHAASNANLTTLHPTLGCDTCHASTSLTITSTTINAAITGHHKECSACHGTGHDLPALHAASPASQTISIKGTDYGKHECVDCHTALDLLTIHAGNCAACHTANVNTTLGGSWTKGCVQGGCHKVGTPLQMHRSIDTSHTLSSIPADFVACGGCHTITTDVAKIHGVVGGPGCAACHGGTKVPTLDCGAVGCHDTDRHPAHPATVTSGTITINSVPYGNFSCTLCHTSMDLRTVVGHASCATCHAWPRNTITGAWDGTCSTAGCHTATRTQHGQINGAHLITAWATGFSGCTGAGCHAGDNDIAKIHGVVGGPGCLACHGGGKTPTTLCGASGCHDGNLDHTAVHDVLTPARADACVSCHAGTNLTAIKSSTGVVSAKHALCATCHAPTSTKISAATIAAAITGSHKECSACHGTGHDLPALHAASPAPAAIVGYGGTALGTHACSECHSLDLRPALHAQCSSCHTATLSVTTTLGGAWAKGCAQGNCHAGTSPLPMHGKMVMHGMSGDDSCHSSEGGPWESWGNITFDIGWAHQQWGRGCATCHDGRDLSGINNCVDCHGDHC